MASLKLSLFNNILRLGLIVIVYLDSYQTKLSPLFHVFYLLVFLNTLYSNYLKNKFFTPSKEFLLLLFLFFNLSFSSHLSCCLESNMRMLIRFGVATSLYMIFYYSDNRRIIFPITIVVSYLNLITVIVSLVGLFIPEFWLKIWRAILAPEGYSYQHFEITRGRISPTFPIYLTTVFPVSLLFYKKKFRFLASISIVSAVISVLLWGYRSYAIVLVFGLIIVSFALLYLKNKWSDRTFLLTSHLKLISLSIFLVYMFFSKYYLSVNIWERFTLKFNIDKQTTEARWAFIGNAFELFKSHPISGVGIGNFPMYQKPLELRLMTPRGTDLGTKISNITLGPHNLLLEFISETGIIGFSLLVILLVSFIKTDIKLLQSIKKPGYKAKNFPIGATYMIISISSWMFIIASQLNSYTKADFYLFFIFRGIIASAILKKWI